jgi:hypothetical protein
MTTRETPMIGTIRSAVVLVVGLVLTASSSAVAQQGSPSVAELQDQISALTAALKACQAGSVNSPVGSARDEALAALRAVESASSGGANVSEFKKYQLDAKVKVDALPVTAENVPLRYVSRIYVDVSSLLIAWQTETLSR